MVFEGEGKYTTEEAIAVITEQLKDFFFNIETSTFKEEDLDDDTGYNCITGNFLIISGNAK